KIWPFSELRKRSDSRSHNMSRSRIPMDLKIRTHSNSYRDASYMRVSHRGYKFSSSN
ncbi:hypothetical protein Tco_1356419, partial [Tanacetum coccineum]